MSFEIIPAIDLRAGRVVRLRQGDYDRQTLYEVEAPLLARRYAQAGARWLHVVDLDGARLGRATQLEVLAELVDCGLQVQAGGGVRNEQDVRCLLELGVARVVVGSLAVREPRRVQDWLQEFGPERLVLALDVRSGPLGWQPATAGWTVTESTTLEKLLPAYLAAGARHLLCTDIDRDGLMGGPAIDLYAELARGYSGLALQASGGARNLEDLLAARAAGAAGIILGRALLDGALDLEAAIAATVATAETAS